MTTIDERLRASDPSHDVEAPEHLLVAILAEPTPAPAPPRRARPRPRVLAGAVAVTACAALLVGVTVPGGGEPGSSGPSFVARAYAQAAPQPTGDEVLHVVSRSTLSAQTFAQTETTESWQQRDRWRTRITTVQTGRNAGTYTEEHVSDGTRTRSTYSGAAPQESRSDLADSPAGGLEDGTTTALDRFRKAYRDREVTDLGIVTYRGREAHAFRYQRAPIERAGERFPRDVTVTTYFDPETAAPLGVEQSSRLFTSSLVITTWERLSPSPANVAEVTGRG